MVTFSTNNTAAVTEKQLQTRCDLHLKPTPDSVAVSRRVEGQLLSLTHDDLWDGSFMHKLLHQLVIE